MSTPATSAEHIQPASPDPTSSASGQPSPTPTARTSSHVSHLRKYFTNNAFEKWSFVSFDTHCRTLPAYEWTHDKIHSFWLDSLNRYLNEKTPYATAKQLENLIQKSKSNSKLPRNQNTKKRKRNIESSIPPPPYTIQGAPVDTINSGNAALDDRDIQSPASLCKAIVTQSQPPSTGEHTLSHGEHETPLIHGTNSVAGLPSTPPPRSEQNPDESVFGTPPAPPPDQPSPVTFKSNGANIDIWFRKLRGRLDGTKQLRLPYLLDSNIFDLDDPHIRQSCIPQYFEELQLLFTNSLPPVHECVTYAIDRFSNSTHLDSYRSITETSPRRPGVAWSRDNAAASYVNNAIGHLITLIDKLAESHANLAPYLREGFFDSSINPWFIDALFVGGNCPNLFISRKEIQSYIPNCPEKSDAIFRYVNGIIAFDVGVVEVSGGTANVNNDTKTDKDLAKCHRAMAGQLQILGDLVEWEWEDVKKLQVIGMINSGWNMTILRMGFVTANVTWVKQHKTMRIPLVGGMVKSVFPLLRLLTRCQTAIEETIKCVLKHQDTPSEI